MLYQFSVFFKDSIVADVIVDTDNNHSEIKRYTSGPTQPFMCDRNDIPYIYEFLKSRCFDDARPDLPQILGFYGLTENNPYEWCKKTHGVCFNDFWSMRFPGENLTWKDVKVRG